MTTGRYGPNTAAVEAFLEVLPHITSSQWRDVLAAPYVSFETRGLVSEALMDADLMDAYRATWHVTDLVAWGVPWHGSRRPAYRLAVIGTATVAALIVRDRISPELFDEVAAPMRATGICFEPGFSSRGSHERS